MTTAQAGTAIAIAVVGWPLYHMVTSGDMDATTALIRGAVVALACVYGVSLIVRLATRYEADGESARRKKLNQLFTDMEGAVVQGTLSDQDVATPPRAQTPPPTQTPPVPPA